MTSPQYGTSRRHTGPTHLATRLFNPVALRFAGTRYFPLYGIIEHQGRRSGTCYRTPVVVQRTGDGFLMPMPWGEGTDWYRNVRAAGGCRLRWRGRNYRLARPEIVEAAVAASNVGVLARLASRRLGISWFLRLHDTAAPVALTRTATAATPAP